MQQKVINITVIVLVVFSLYFGIYVDYKRVQTMNILQVSDVELQGHKNVIDEEYRRLTLKFEGRGKHMQRMQADIANLRGRLKTVTDSLGNRLEELNFRISDVEENLRDEIRTVERDLRAVNEDLSTYKRRTNRSVLDIQERLNVIESDLKTLIAPEEEEED